MGAYTNIDDPSAYFQTKLYVGTSGLSIPVTHTNDGNSDLQPDLIWGKDRSTTYGHYLCDSSRGRSKYLYSETNGAEVTTDAAGNDIVSFDTDGFKVGAPSAAISTNAGNGNKVAWQWKANGGTTASNSDGSTASTVQVNQDAGFSIITYTGTGSETTFGHGLGVAPEAIIAKKRGGAASWVVWFKAFNNSDGYLVLNATDKMEEATTIFTNTDPTSSVITLGSSSTVNQNTVTHLMYAFSPKQGYSKFGSYKGNGNADGPFVYTGFQPAFILFKKSSDAGDNWMMYDYKRPGYNVTDEALHPNSAVGEYDNANANLDILSNGFKLRSSFGWVNQSSHTYMYMAFAKHPFVTSTGIPTTAR